MSTAPTSYPSLCSSPSLPRTNKQNPLLLSINQNKQQPLFKNHAVYTISSNTQLPKSCLWVVKASETESPATESSDKEEEKYEEYEVEIEKPYGLKFVKGRDGGTYIDAIAPGGSADQTNMFTVGDKVLATRYTHTHTHTVSICLCLKIY